VIRSFGNKDTERICM